MQLCSTEGDKYCAYGVYLITCGAARHMHTTKNGQK